MFWITYIAALVGLLLPSTAAPTQQGVYVWGCTLVGATGWAYQLQIHLRRDGHFALSVMAPRGAVTTHATNRSLRAVLHEAYALRVEFARASARAAPAAGG